MHADCRKRHVFCKRAAKYAPLTAAGEAGVRLRKKSMEELIDLGDIADSLVEMFPDIKGLYIFGSRAFGTGSTRSDIDILVEYDNHIRPAKMREFIEWQCKALDLFLIDKNNKAISTQNESYVQEDTFENLISKLNAKKFWEKGKGRLPIDIPWKQSVRSDIVFVPSALPETKNNKQTQIDLEKQSINQIFTALTTKQLYGIVSVPLAAVIAIFSGGYWFGSNTIVMKDKPPITMEIKSNKPNK